MITEQLETGQRGVELPEAGIAGQQEAAEPDSERQHPECSKADWRQAEPQDPVAELQQAVLQQVGQVGSHRSARSASLAAPAGGPDPQLAAVRRSVVHFAGHSAGPGHFAGPGRYSDPDCRLRPGHFGFDHWRHLDHPHSDYLRRLDLVVLYYQPVSHLDPVEAQRQEQLAQQGQIEQEQQEQGQPFRCQLKAILQKLTGRGTYILARGQGGRGSKSQLAHGKSRNGRVETHSE